MAVTKLPNLQHGLAEVTTIRMVKTMKFGRTPRVKEVVVVVVVVVVVAEVVVVVVEMFAAVERGQEELAV